MTDRLFYFPPTTTEHGTAPSFYDRVHPDHLRHALSAGGRDVSDNPDAWAAYDRALDAAYWDVA